ncbi:uncharacterized protein HaLaN_31455, partial [Haematococcus lacustris]
MLVSLWFALLCATLTVQPPSVLGASGTYYCRTYSQISDPLGCPLCVPGSACMNLNTADRFWVDPRICTLPDIPLTAAIPNTNKLPQSNICMQSGQSAINSV